METKQIISKEKIEKIAEKKRKDIEKSGIKPDKYPFSIPYRVRSHCFSSGNLSFDAETGLGTSYRWYHITRVLKGTLYLNTYKYSSSTSQHIRKLWSLLTTLGIRFRELDAPRGLQDLDWAKTYALQEFGERFVRSKYSRDTKKLDIKSRTRNIDELERLGIKITLKERKLAVIQAEENRKGRLERARKRKIERRKLDVEYEIKRMIRERSAPWSETHITEDEVSPNFVADIARKLNIQLTSEQIVEISDHFLK